MQITPTAIKSTQNEFFTVKYVMYTLIKLCRFAFHSQKHISTVSTIKDAACTLPENPSNGYLLPVYGPNEKLVYINYWCHPPFTLTGAQKRTCQPNGTWSGSTPSCVKGTFAPGVLYLFFLCFVFSFFSSVCLRQIPHTEFIEGVVSALFQPHTGQTGPNKCAPPSKLLHGYHRPAPGAAGGSKTIEFSCKNSYILIGSHLSTCLSNGSWSSRPPKCVRGSCFQIHTGVENTLLAARTVACLVQLQSYVRTAWNMTPLLKWKCTFSDMWINQLELCDVCTVNTLQQRRLK